MDSSSIGSGSTASSIQIDVMKKAQDVAAQNILGVLESSSQQDGQTSAAITGIGKNIDIKA